MTFAFVRLDAASTDVSERATLADDPADARPDAEPPFDGPASGSVTATADGDHVLDDDRS